MLADMPVWKLGREEEERLRQLAVRHNRSLREQAEYYIRCGIERDYPDLLQRLIQSQTEPIAEVA